MKALCYGRVSTERDQSPDAQVNELERYCNARGWTIANTIVDHGYSGGTDKRPGLQELMWLVRSRKVDILVVTKLDRLARSLKHLVGLLDELTSLGVIFISIHDQIDLTTATGRLMTNILGSFAEFERSLVRERTLLGLAYAKSQGKVLGRPQLHDPNMILKLRMQGLTYREIANALKAPMGSITRAIKSAHKTPSKVDKNRPIKSGAGNG